MPVDQTTLVAPVAGDSPAVYRPKFAALFDRTSELQKQASGRPLNPAEYGTWGEGLDVTDALLATIAAAESGAISIEIPAGNYALTGSTALEINLGKFSVKGDGHVIFDCSGMSATDVVHLYSSLSYPQAHYTNTAHKLSGIVFVGDGTSGAHGLRLGHSTYDSNCQMLVEDCGFYNFDRGHHFINNSWRAILRRCAFVGSVNYHLYVPSGLTNAGECIGYEYCMFADGGGSITIACDNWQTNFFASSVLNTPIVLSGTSVNCQFFGGNIENPGAQAEYKFIDITGASLCRLSGTNFTFNPGITYTDAPLYVTSASGLLVLDGVIVPDGTPFETETVLGYRTLVGGAGRVLLGKNYYWVGSGGFKFPVTKSPNAVRNGDFETGDTAGWTVATYGTSGATAVASATALCNGTYGLLVTAGESKGINVTQVVQVRPGELFQAGANVKVATSAGATNGYFQAVFKDVDGAAIETRSSAIGTSAAWEAVGSTLCGYVPDGAVTVVVTINGQPLAGPVVIYFDDVIVNLHG